MPKPPNPLNSYKHCPNCKSALKLQVLDNQRVKVCPKCDFIYWNNPKPVTSVVLPQAGKVLMLQRAQEPFKDYWVLPGGYLAYEESAQEAAIREIQEETGLEGVIGGLVGVYRNDDDPRGIDIDIIFEGQAAGEIKLSAEDSAWRFFSPDDLPKNIAYKHRQAIADWLAKHESA